MSEMRVTMSHNDELIAVLHTLRRATRALRRILDVVDEDDVQRKFKQFIEEHEAFSEKLKTHLKEYVGSDTPQEIIQFPISTDELFEIAAKSEKQVIDEIEDRLGNSLPQKISEQNEANSG